MFSRVVLIAFTSLLLSAACAAASTDCLKSFYAFGQNFKEAQLGLKIAKKHWTTSNPNGDAGEKIFWTASSAKGNRMERYTCKSCSSRTGITELFLVAGTLPCGVVKGMRGRDIVSRLETLPYAVDQGRIIYSFLPAEESWVTFLLTDGVLQAVKWDFFLD